MICPHCREELPANAVFCTACGADLRAKAPGRKKAKKRPVLWVILGLLAFAIVAQGVFMAVSYSRNNRVTQEDLDSLVDTVRSNVASIEDYFDYELHSQDPFSDRYVQRGLNANTVDLNRSILCQTYGHLVNRWGWKAEEYGDYQALYAAYEELYAYFDAYRKGEISFDQAEYDALLETFHR